MDLISYIGILRRRWSLVVTVIALALVAIWVTLPDRESSGPVVTSYQATATLVTDPTAETPLNLAVAARFATVGEVPERAAAALGFGGEPQLLASGIATAVDTEAGTMDVTTTGEDKARTARTANAFAEQVVAYFERKEQQTTRENIAELNALLQEYRERLRALDREIAGSGGAASAAEAEREGLGQQYAAVSATVSELNKQLAADPPLEILQPAVALPAETATFAPPSRARDRLLIGGALGVLLGVALALVVERIDSRLRTREQAESAFQLPVLAEIPVLPWGHRKEPTVLSATAPGSATAESYRGLRSAVHLLMPGVHDDADTAAGRSTVLLVTSARPGEGKTATVANLAVVMAESGRSVLVLSLDFRNPRIHDYLDVASGAGLSDVLKSGRPGDLNLVVRDSPFAGVRVATSGLETGHPGALLTGVGPLIEQARGLADIVLIDTAPLLAVSDAVDLSPHVDGALVVTRLNRTTSYQAVAAQRLLTRLRVPAIGAVLIGTPGGASFDSYVTRSSVVEHVASRLGVQTSRRRQVHTASANPSDNVRATSTSGGKQNDEQS